MSDSLSLKLLSEALSGLFGSSSVNFLSLIMENDYNLRTESIFLPFILLLSLLFDLQWGGSREELDPIPLLEKELFCLVLCLLHTLYLWHAIGLSLIKCSMDAGRPSRYVYRSINTFLFKVSFPSIILENLQSIKIDGLTFLHRSLNSSGWWLLLLSISLVSSWMMAYVLMLLISVWHSLRRLMKPSLFI